MNNLVYIVYNLKTKKIIHATFNQLIAYHKAIATNDTKNIAMIAVDYDTLHKNISYICYDIKSRTIVTIENSLNNTYKDLAIKAMNGSYLGDTIIIKFDKNDII